MSNLEKRSANFNIRIANNLLKSIRSVGITTDTYVRFYLRSMGISDDESKKEFMGHLYSNGVRRFGSYFTIT